MKQRQLLYSAAKDSYNNKEEKYKVKYNDTQFKNIIFQLSDNIMTITINLNKKDNSLLPEKDKKSLIDVIGVNIEFKLLFHLLESITTFTKKKISYLLRNDITFYMHNPTLTYDLNIPSENLDI